MLVESGGKHIAAILLSISSKGLIRIDVGIGESS